MNDNSIAISKYLQQEMNSEEIASFELMLATDPSLREELLAQQQVMQAAQNAGLKQTFASLIHKKMMWQRFTWLAGIVLLLTVAIIVYFVAEENGNAGKQAVSEHSTVSRFVQPPLATADMPWTEYELDAEKGDTIFHSTGSILLFPPSSMVDENGLLIKGKVQVRYREFSNPLDFYLSGIPMNYDSAGTNYTFISAGMCEIIAQQNGKAVFVNPAAKPEINLVTNDKSSLHNIYYLDTVQKKWLPKSKSVLMDLSRQAPAEQALYNAFHNGDSMVGSSDDFFDVTDTFKPVDKRDYDISQQPLAPSRPDRKNPVIRIAVDPASFKELMAYDNLQFELMPNEKNFNPKDTTGEWSDVQLKRIGNTGFYLITFSRPGRVVTYQAKPVFENDKDFDKAMAEFKQKQAQYETTKQARILKEKKDYEIYRADSLEQAGVEKENEQINRLNKLMQKRNRQTKTAVAVSQANYNNRAFRPITISRFGIWNCDTPFLMDLMEITAKYTDQNNAPIQLTQVAVYCKNYNTAFRFTNNKMGLVKNTDNMIIGLSNGVFTYLTYEDFAAQNKNPSDTNRTFKMTVSGKEEIDYPDLLKHVNRDITNK